MTRFRRVRAGGARLFLLRRVPDFVLAYYEFCAGAIEQVLVQSEAKGDFYLALPIQSGAVPTKSHFVCLQTEHTLVRAGGRDLADAPLGSVPELSGSGVYHVRLAGRMSAFERSSSVIEYSRPNIINVRGSSLSDVYADRVEYVAPLIGDRSWHHPTGMKPRVITMHSGTGKGRRGDVEDRLRGLGLEVVNISGVWRDYGRVFTEPSVLVNVHQTDHHHTLEELRVLPALLAGAVVVTEDFPLVEAVPYGRFLIRSSFEDLPSVVLATVNDFEQRWDEIFGGHEFGAVLGQLRTSNARAFQSIASRGTSAWGDPNGEC